MLTQLCFTIGIYYNYDGRKRILLFETREYHFSQFESLVIEFSEQSQDLVHRIQDALSLPQCGQLQDGSIS